VIEKKLGAGGFSDVEKGRKKKGETMPLDAGYWLAVIAGLVGRS